MPVVGKMVFGIAGCSGRVANRHGGAFRRHG